MFTVAWGIWHVAWVSQYTHSGLNYRSSQSLVGGGCALQVEIKLFVAMLVSRFEIRPDPERMPDCTVSEFIANHLKVQISLKLKAPAMLRMKKRV